MMRLVVPAWLETHALGTLMVYESCMLESPHFQPFQTPKGISRDLLPKVIADVVANQSLP